MKNKLMIPKFATEAEEAEWLDASASAIEQRLGAAMRKGLSQRGVPQQLAREFKESRNVTIRMAEADLALARKQAQAKGLPYQTYIKSLLHEQLIKREGRRLRQGSAD